MARRGDAVQSRRHAGCRNLRPVHRTTPLSVPIHRSPRLAGKEAVDFQIGQTLHDPRDARALHPQQTGVARAQPDDRRRRDRAMEMMNEEVGMSAAPAMPVKRPFR